MEREGAETEREVKAFGCLGPSQWHHQSQNQHAGSHTEARQPAIVWHA